MVGLDLCEVALRQLKYQPNPDTFDEGLARPELTEFPTHDIREQLLWPGGAHLVWAMPDTTGTVSAAPFFRGARRSPFRSIDAATIGLSFRLSLGSLPDISEAMTLASAWQIWFSFCVHSVAK